MEAMNHQTNSLDLTREQLHLVRELLREHIPHAEVWAYGSRVKWTATSKSDLDLVAHVDKEAKGQINALREAFEESSLPFRVDFYLWDEVPVEFHAQIEREYFVMQRQLEESKLEKNFLPLGDCLSYTAKGITPKYLNANSDNSILVLNQKCNRNFKIDFNLARFHNAQQKKVPIEKILNIGDVLINSTGTGTAGRVAQVLSLPDASTVDSHMIILRSNDHLDTSYFGYAVKFNQREIEYLAEGSTGQTEINRKRLSTEIKIFCPSLQTQKQIAHVLSTIDKKIELNQRINENLEQQAQAIFKSWFADANSKTTFEEIVNILGGGTPKTSIETFWHGEIPFFTPKDASMCYTLSTEKRITTEGLNNCNSKLFPTNTVFITARGTVGKIALAGVPMAMNQSCYALVGKNGVGQYFIYHLIKNIVRSLQHKANGGVFDAITTRDLKSESIFSYSAHRIESFNSTVAPLYNKILSKSQENIKLTALRDTLLPKLMSGEIDVSQVKL